MRCLVVTDIAGGDGEEDRLLRSAFGDGTQNEVHDRYMATSSGNTRARCRLSEYVGQDYLCGGLLPSFSNTLAGTADWSV